MGEPSAVLRVVQRHQRRLRQERRDQDAQLVSAVDVLWKRAAFEALGQISHSLRTLEKLARDLRQIDSNATGGSHE